MSRSLYLFLLLLIVGTAFGFPAAEVVEEEEDDKKIIGGRATDISKHKSICSYRVYLRKDDFSVSYSQFCGSTILNERWLLTAAHCVDAAFEAKVQAESQCYEPVKKNLDPDVSRCTCDMFVTCGITGTRDRGQDIPIDLAIAHPLWNPNGVGPHDIALLKTQRDIQFTPNVQPAIIAGNHIDPAREGKGLIVGWGATDPYDTAGSQSPVLKEALIEIHPIDVCYRMFGPTKIIRGSQICIGNTTQTSCGGDSGGPLYLKHNGVWLLRGATSFGGKICGQVNSVYIDLMFYLPWIQEKIARHDPRNPPLQIET